MDFGHSPSGFGAVATALLLAGQMPLRAALFPLPRPVVAGSAHLLPSERTRKLGGSRTISKPTAWSSRIGAFAAGISNFTTTVTNQCPTAVRLKVALLVANSIACDWRIRIRPIDGTYTHPFSTRTRWGIRNDCLGALFFLEPGKLSPALEEIEIGAPEIGQRW